MSELTKQYFDKQLSKLATKEEMKKLATKEDIKDVRVALEEKIETEVGNLARMTEDRFNEIKRELDVRKEVDQLKSQMSKVWSALNIKQ